MRFETGKVCCNWSWMLICIVRGYQHSGGPNGKPKLLLRSLLYDTCCTHREAIIISGKLPRRNKPPPVHPQRQHAATWPRSQVMRRVQEVVDKIITEPANTLVLAWQRILSHTARPKLFGDICGSVLW